MPGSWANRMRERRFRLFRNLIAGMPRPLRIIDVGGTELFWEQMDFAAEMGSGGEMDAGGEGETTRQKTPAGEGNIEITLLNLQSQQVRNPGFVAVEGDARDLSRFEDQSFDVAFSNSVIEHVGNFDDQARMASEMQRVGKHIFLQTPNRNFPLEPHFLFPFFQFLPLRCQVWLLMRFSLGWYPRFKNKETATEAAKSVRLLTRKELKKLFPHATIHKEKLAGLTKSYVVIQNKQTT